MAFRSRLKHHGVASEGNVAETPRRPGKQAVTENLRGPQLAIGLVSLALLILGILVVQCTQDSGLPAGDSGDAGGGGRGDAGGDRGAAAGVVRQPDVELPAHVDRAVKPSWTGDEIRKIQRELARLGLYRVRIDGDLADRTAAGLVEAFGDNTWRTMTAAEVLTRLGAARPVTGDQREHALRYGEMFADGLFDITLGLGFDESDWHKLVLVEIEQALTARSFVVNNALGMELYREAGRAVPANPSGTFWVRTEPLTYKPPAGAARPIQVIVRFVGSPDGKNGAEAASAFKEGMIESDATFYGGHGRYGSGPDFDRNFTIELFDGQGALEQFFDDYARLENYLRNEGRPQGRSAWAQFLWRVKRDRIAVHGDNQGNVRLTKTNPHPGEFGALLMFWNLDQPGTGVVPVTGQRGELAGETQAHPGRTYRALAFDGCRADDYENSLRATPGMDKHTTDTFASTISLYWGDIGATMAAFLDSSLGMQSAEGIARAMDHAQITTRMAGKGTIQAFGVDDNPIYR
ncbi:MAG TPA: peptidoglycan-binding domain-containing protein [Kofleriaceae bacterium]|nr:peptidoglycan-binding domain-containing protein [Kofleriaceae bacterium]